MKTARLITLVLLLAGLVAGGAVASGASFSSGSDNPTSTLASAADWTAPTVTLTDPGTPLRGNVTLSAQAADATSGVTSVSFAVRLAGSSSWTTVCTASASPYSCSFDSKTLADGTYDVRAVATDGAGNTATSIVGDRVLDNTTFAVALDPPAAYLRGSVTLTASVSGATTVSSVRIQIKQIDASTWQDVCADATAPYSCVLDTTKYPADTYELRALATNTAGTSVTSTSSEADIDNVAPNAITLADPGTMRGVVTLAASATDADSGVMQVLFQYARAGSGVWVDICTDTSDPFTCRFDTTTAATPDGSYDVRAIVSDYAGNTRIATRTSRPIDNTIPTVSLEDPGALLSGTVTLSASANTGNGVKEVAIQRRVNGTSTWTTVCTDTTPPFACVLDTTTLTDGLYDFQAVMTPNVGNAVTSATVTARRIDNNPLRGLDVQTANGTGSKLGKFDLNDRVTLTWTEAVKPSSIVGSWSGTAPLALTARLRDGQLAGTADGHKDVLDFPDAPNLGRIVLAGDYIGGGKTLTHAASATLSGATMTITVGTLASGGGARTIATRGAMTWTPTTSITDLAGLTCSNAPVTESGPADVEF